MSVASSRVTFNTAGQYVLTATLQLYNSDAVNSDYYLLWLKVNGVDQTYSAARATVGPLGRDGQVQGRAFMEMAAPDLPGFAALREFAF
jgi:hypothetical protein